MKYHEAIFLTQIRYLSDELRIRYGFSEMWNQNLNDEANLLSLDKRYQFLKDTFGRIIFRDGSAVPQKEIPGTKSNSFLLMKKALKKRIDYKEVKTPEENKIESFRIHTISKVNEFDYFLGLIWSKEDYKE